MSMCFVYNAQMTFQLLESQGSTHTVFALWFKNMNEFKKDFELRRLIFGLTSILRLPTSSMPALITQKLNDIMFQLILLCQKMHTERQKILEDNKKNVAEGGKDDWDESDDDEGDDDGMMNGDDDDFEDSDEEWKKQQKLFSKLGSKLHTGKALTKEEMEEFELNPDLDDDDDDSDYEYTGGDTALYDSLMDD